MSKEERLKASFMRKKNYLKEWSSTPYYNINSGTVSSEPDLSCLSTSFISLKKDIGHVFSLVSCTKTAPYTQSWLKDITRDNIDTPISGYNA